MSHEKACFITLTYDNDNLVYNSDYLPQLCKSDVQLFLKRVRKKFYSVEIRYYCAGEYGEKTKRPHYHLIIFGIDFADYGLDFHKSSDLLRSLWSYGNNLVGSCTSSSIQYVAGYVTKKFVNKKKDTITPEFTLMSRRPGIGFYALDSYEQLFNNSRSIIDYVNKNGVLPDTVQFNGRSYPLDRYFKWKLYNTLDLSEKIMFSKFIAKTLQRQHEAFDLGFTDLIEFEDKIDQQRRLNKTARFGVYSKVREI